MVCKRIPNALDVDERQALRDWALELCLDQVTVYDLLSKEQESEVSFTEKCTDLVEDCIARLRNQEDDPVTLLSDLRCEVSQIFLDESDLDESGLSNETYMVLDKVKSHAENGGGEVLAQKTRPTSPRLFGKN